MINLSDIYIQYGDRILYDHINITIKEGEKIGLIGRNGCGKSTLLKILADEIRPDEGKIDIPKGVDIGYLSQMNRLNPEHTVREAAMEAFETIIQLRSEIKMIETKLTSDSISEEDLIQYSGQLSDAHEHYAVLGGDQAESELERVLKGLGFKQEELDRQVSTFSGGWKMRIELAKLLLSKPNYLLLDEPTNHLDIESIIWLEQYLSQYPYSVIVVSHDQRFLDNVTKRTIEIVNGKTYDYRLPYSKFVERRTSERELQASAFKNQQKDIQHKEKLIDKFRAKSSKAKFAKSLQKQLDRIDRIQLDDADSSAMRIRFPESPRGPQVMFKGMDISKRFDNHLVFSDFNFEVLRNERIAFVGQNGQGKSTLAKILVGDLEISSGDLIKKENIFQSYYAQDQAERLDPKETLLSTIEQYASPEQRRRLRNILGSFLFSGDDVDKKVSVLSGGERARLALACMILHPINLLVLDEPTHHLDIQSKEILKQALQEYQGTLIVVSHDRQFLDGLTNRVLEFRDGRIYHHIGDIESFLKKRNVTDMNDLEKKSQNKDLPTGIPADSVKPELDYQTRKEYQRRVQYAERDIEKLESGIAQIETEMHHENFYEREDANEKMKSYGEMKKKLEEKMKEWEDAVAKLEGV